MGSVKRDIRRNEYEWIPVNLSDIKSIKGLLKYRYKFDLLFELKSINIFDTYVYLNQYKEEIMCLYIWLDEMIKKCSLNAKQETILSLYMSGYTELDIAELLNYTQQNVNGIINSICKKILNQVNINWLHDNIYWNKLRVKNNYCRCKKCNSWLPYTNEFFVEDKTYNSGLYNLCKYCKT